MINGMEWLSTIHFRTLSKNSLDQYSQIKKITCYYLLKEVKKLHKLIHGEKRVKVSGRKEQQRLGHDRL